MKASDFLIAEEINKIIKALSRDMHENVKHIEKYKKSIGNILKHGYMK